MRLRLRRLWVILAVFLCVGGAFGLRGIGQKGTEAAAPDPNPNPSEEEPSTDSQTGTYKIWFVTDGGDINFDDPDGLKKVQWNLPTAESSSFGRPGTSKITARLSISGDTATDFTGIVDRLEWNYTIYDAVNAKEIVDITDYSPSQTGIVTEKALLVNAKAAGLVSVTFTVKGYRGTEEIINVSREVIIGSPLQIFDSAGAAPTKFSTFNEQKKETTIYANNADIKSCQIYWFFVDADGNYDEATPQILLTNPIPENIPANLPGESKIVEIPEQSGTSSTVTSANGNVKILPYGLKAKETGGFTRIVGRIYLDGQSTAREYVECTYDVMNMAKFRESQYTIENGKKVLKLSYGDKKRYNVLANDLNHSLGWVSYANRTGVLQGTKEGDVIVIGQDEIRAQNYGTVTLEATAIYGDWEYFDKIGKDVTDILEVSVAADILKGKTSKSIIDKTEVISVGGTIPLSTNVVSRSGEYEYEWYYLVEGGVETGSAIEVGSGWLPLKPSVNDPRFSIVESTSGSEGITSLTIQGKTNGQVRMRCIVKTKNGGSTVIGEEEGTFTIRIVDTMTLSETRKTIAVGGKFDIDAYISGREPGTLVEWSVVDSSYVDNIGIASIGPTSATVTGLAPTDGRYVECRALVEINGTTTSATFYVMVVPSIDGVYIEATPSRIISVGGSAKLDLILETTGTTFTKDQIKWVLKDFTDPQGNVIPADTIIRKEDSTSNILQSTVTGLSVGEAYVAVVTNDSAQTEIAVITIKVVSEVTGLKLNKEEHKLYLPTGNNDEPDRSSFVLIATPLPEGYTDSENLGIEWKPSPDDGTVTITPDPQNSLRATVTANNIGIVRVTANVSGLPSAAAFCMFTIENAAEKIDLDPKGPYELRVGETQIVTPILTPENVTNPNVTWTMENPNIATVSRAGVITGVSPGTTFITCTTSNGLSVQYPVTVLNPVERIELNYTELTVKKGTVFFLSANVLPEDAADRTVTWSTSDESICTVDENGTVTANTTGQCIITATSNDNPEIKAECRVTVTESVAGITLNYREKTIDIGETFVLKATVLPSDANDRGVTFTSSNPAVATVDANGLVTGVSGGTTIIVVRTNDRGLIATCTVTVRQDVTKITFDVTDIYLPKGETRKISYTIEPPNATISDLEWSSSDPSIAFVDSEGYVHGVALGEVTITATAKDGSKISATCKVTVINPVTEIRLSETSLIMMEGDEHTLTYIISPQNASVTNVKWTSSDVSVATVNSLGIVKALREGETRIRVEATDNSGVYAECIVVVKPYIPITSIRLNSTDTTMILGESRRLTDRTYPNNTTERAEWRSSDTGIVTVDGEGNVVAVGPGTCTITKIGVTSGIEGSCTIHVIGLTATEVTIEKYDTFDLYLDDPDADIRWFSRDKRTATVNRNGVVTGRRPGTTYIVADLNGKLVSCRVTVVDMNRSQQDTVNAASNVAANTQ